jgi:hypothetical protein
MPRFKRLVPFVTLLLACGCYSDDPAGLPDSSPATTIEITDAPFPYDSVARVDLYIVSIAVNAAADTSTPTGWITVAEPRTRYNLIALSGGVTDTLGTNIVPAGTYRAVRMVIDTDSSSITAKDGGLLPVAWQSSAGRPTLFALVEDALAVPDSGASIVIDFDVGRSFLCTTPCDTFTFSPVFRAVNRAATGAVSGSVLGDTLSASPDPISDVTVTVFSGNPASSDATWSVRATGKTDAAGFFRIAYLRPGTYILRADAPRGSAYTPGVRSNVIVTAGVEVPNQGIVLPTTNAAYRIILAAPPYVTVSDSSTLYGYLLDSAGRSVPGAVYTWSVLDSGLAQLFAEPDRTDRVLFKPSATGDARVRVTASQVSTTLTIAITPPPGPGATRWVNITPDTGLVAVAPHPTLRDTVRFTATARDSSQAVVAGVTFSWTINDTTIATLTPSGGANGTALVRALRAGTTQLIAETNGRVGVARVVVF